MRHVGHVQAVIVVHNHMVAASVESERIISAGTKFYNTVNREVLWVIFEVIPRARHDVAHVGARDVNIVLISTFRWLVLAPIPVKEWRTVVPSVGPFIISVGQSCPQMAGLVVP